jgi:hypothetical protein
LFPTLHPASKEICDLDHVSQFAVFKFETPSSF